LKKIFTIHSIGKECLIAGDDTMKNILKALLALGVCSGLALSGCQNGNEDHKNRTENHQVNDEKSFLEALSPEGKEMYKMLDKDHQMEAMELSSYSICDPSGKCRMKEGKMDPDTAVHSVYKKQNSGSNGKKARTENGGYHYHLEKDNDK
jgi:hypothetical protein